MKDRGLLHPQLSRVLAETGHGDLIGIADAGLPLPPPVERVDLALPRGVVAFADAARAVLAELRARDAQDSSRAVAPLRPAADAVTLDTTELDAEAAFQAARAVVARKLPR